MGHYGSKPRSPSLQIKNEHFRGRIYMPQIHRLCFLVLLLLTYCRFINLITSCIYVLSVFQSAHYHEMSIPNFGLQNVRATNLIKK